MSAETHLSGVAAQRPTPSTPAGAMLSTEGAAALLGVSPRTLERWRVSGDGPRYVRIGPRMVRYPEDAVAAWANARTFDHRSAELATGANRSISAGA